MHPHRQRHGALAIEAIPVMVTMAIIDVIITDTGMATMDMVTIINMDTDTMEIIGTVNMNTHINGVLPTTVGHTPITLCPLAGKI